MSRTTTELSPAMQRIADKIAVACDEWDWTVRACDNGDEFITVKTGDSVRKPLLRICLSRGSIGVGLQSQFSDSAEEGFSVMASDEHAIDRAFSFACGLMFGLEW